MDTDSEVTKITNIFKQYQLFQFEDLQWQAHAAYVMALRLDQALLKGPWQARVIKSGEIVADNAVFYIQVHSNAITMFITNSLTPTGYAKLVQGKLEQISFIVTVTDTLLVDGPYLLYLFWDIIDQSKC